MNKQNVNDCKFARRAKRKNKYCSSSHDQNCNDLNSCLTGAYKSHDAQLKPRYNVNTTTRQTLIQIKNKFKKN